ncbi:MAG TPA: hypothetical protein VFZ65_06305 [Planctomycetota bacterium]|nr:hypothetical protein [Planctomycetota bacterium]
MNDSFDRPADPQCAYSLPHYRWILEQAKSRYWLPLVREVARGVPDRAFLLVRHDVDITPWSALRMAELERSLGVATTYYYRLHAPFYNLMDGAVLDSVRAVAAMGHEVGLHYEPGFFLVRDMDPVAGTRSDLRTFEELLGFRTHTIAQHQPAQGPVLADISEHHPCAYQPALVRDIPYFGDSGFHWREGCVCTKLHLRQLHTLIHPHSWVRDRRSWQEVLRAHAAGLGNRLQAEMEAYVQHVEGYLARRAEFDRAREQRYRT